jgi:hypothetical protein
MKRFIFYSITTLFLNPLSAQFQCGVKSGINVSEFIAYKSWRRDFKLGGNAGFFCVAPINRNFLLQAELIYSSKGSGMQRYYYNRYNKMNSKLQYLNLPLMLGFRAVNKLKLLLGPEVGLLASTNDSGPYRKIDFSGVAGAGYSICNNIGVEVRYDHGFSKLIKGLIVSQDGTVEGYKYFGSNRTFQASLWYQFDLKN